MGGQPANGPAPPLDLSLFILPVVSPSVFLLLGVSGECSRHAGSGFKHANFGGVLRSRVFNDEAQVINARRWLCQPDLETVFIPDTFLTILQLLTCFPSARV